MLLHWYYFNLHNFFTTLITFEAYIILFMYIFIILINERIYILFYSYNYIFKKAKDKNLIKNVNVSQLNDR